jgi:hypothetical protein
MCGLIGEFKQGTGEQKYMSNTGIIEISDVSRSLGLTIAYHEMLGIIQKSEIAIANATAQHGKSHSQFQYAALDCSGPVAGFTKLRNWRQVLAVIDRTREAIEDAYLALQEQEVNLDAQYESRNSLDQNGSVHSIKLLDIQIAKSSLHVTRIKRNLLGAIRKLSTYTLQFEELERQIRIELGKEDHEPITEEDFEKDEERFHIMKVFQQALQAARSNGGRVDHGNMIYFDDVGINGSLAQRDIKNYLEETESSYSRLGTDVHGMYLLEVSFLKDMAKKYAGCSRVLIEAKGMIPGVLPGVTLKNLIYHDKEE